MPVRIAVVNMFSLLVNCGKKDVAREEDQPIGFRDSEELGVALMEVRVDRGFSGMFPLIWDVLVFSCC